MTENPYFTKLKNRALIHVEGNDAEKFLQNLITNNMDHLQTKPMIYACLLSPQGKFLHDFFVHRGDGFYIIDCEGNERATDLFNRLNMYRLRADVQISIEDNIPVYAIIGTNKHGQKDPRHDEMGYRSFEKPDGLNEQPFDTWDIHRINLCVPDGSRDLIVNKSTMDEGHMDQINAIDYDKGCYVGQELTARMHYRGLGKKHLQTVDIKSLPEKAELRSQCSDIGIALVRS